MLQHSKKSCMRNAQLSLTWFFNPRHEPETLRCIKLCMLGAALAVSSEACQTVASTSCQSASVSIPFLGSSKFWVYCFSFRSVYCWEDLTPRFDVMERILELLAEWACSCLSRHCSSRFLHFWPGIHDLSRKLSHLGRFSKLRLYTGDLRTRVLLYIADVAITGLGWGSSAKLRLDACYGNSLE